MEDELNGIIVSHKPVSESSLKRLLMIFDKIYFLDSNQNNFLIPNPNSRAKPATSKSTKPIIDISDYGLLYNGINYEIEDNQLFNKFDYAISKGIVRIINLHHQTFYHKNSLPLSLSYEYDTANAELLNSIIPLLKKENNISTSNGITRGMWFQKYYAGPFPDVPPQVTFYDDETNKRYSLDLQLSSIIAKLNRTLAVSNEYNLIPIFLNEYLANAFSIKIEIAKKNSEYELNNVFLKTNRNTLDSVQYLLHKISEIILPDEVINSIPIKELLYARNNTYYECIKLRRKLIKTLTFLSGNTFDDNFIDDVNKYIQLEVEPLLNNYQNRFIQTLNEFLKVSLPFGATIAGATIGIQQSLSPMAIAYLSAISATVGGVSSRLSQYVLKKPKEKFNNTFSYFINLKE